MVAAGLGIPVSYYGTHLSGGQTRASAIVATEPVAKRFEGRQKLYERVIRNMWKRLMSDMGIDSAECEVTFPEIITQDRTQKLQDLALAKSEEWISNERAGEIAAKELHITDYIYSEEIEKIRAEGPTTLEPMMNPLTAPPKSNASVSGEERQQVKDQNGYE